MAHKAQKSAYFNSSQTYIDADYSPYSPTGFELETVCMNNQIKTLLDYFDFILVLLILTSDLIQSKLLLVISLHKIIDKTPLVKTTHHNFCADETKLSKVSYTFNFN